MINNYNDPRVTLTQVYKQPVLGTQAVLGACIIGPNYLVYNYEKQSNSLKLEGSAAGIAAQEYPMMTYDPYATEDGVDTNSVKVFVKDAELRFASMSSTNHFIFTVSSQDTITIQYSDSGTVKAVPLYGEEFGTDTAEVFSPSESTLGVPVRVGDIAIINNKHYPIIRLQQAAHANKFLLASDLSTSTITSLQICRVSDAYVSKSAVTAGKTTVAVSAYPASQQIMLDSSVASSDKAYTILGGEFYVEYRILSERFNKIAGYAAGTDAVQDIFQDVSAANPLGCAVHAAANAAGDRFVYFVSTADVSEAKLANEYARACDVVGNTDGIHGIVPCTDNADVLRTLLAIVNSQSAEDIPYFKFLYGSVEFPDEVTLLKGVGIKSAQSVAAGTKITFESNVLVGLTENVKGDYIRISGTDYKIIATNSKDNVTIAEAYTKPAGTVTCSIVVKDKLDDNTYVIDYLVKNKAVADKRAALVIADNPMYRGQVVPNYVVSSAISGLRSSSYPQAPLSNVAVPGITIAGGRGITYSQSKVLGANGFWRVGENTAGVAVTRRQLTSAAAGDVNYDEQSIICAVDAVCLNLKFAGRGLVGNTNITDNLINLLQTELRSRMLTFTESASTLIGPMLISCTLDSIAQDTVDKSRIKVSISGEPPKPFNEFNITFYMM